MKITLGPVKKTMKGNDATNTEVTGLDVNAAPSIDTCLNGGETAVAAYYLAEQRGFAPGGDLSDWFQAEAGQKIRSSPNTG